CQSCATEYPYDPTDRSETWDVNGVIRAQRIEFIATRLVSPAIVYQIEGDRRYAEQIAPIIERFAEVYKNYRLNKVNANVWAEEENHHYYGRIAGWKHRDGYVVM